MLRLSAAAIRAKIRVLEKEAQKAERRSTKGLRAVAVAIDRHGLSLAQLREAFTLSKGRRKRSPVAGRKVPVKYRDSKGNAWTGRGRPPLWLVAAEKAGKKRETFLVAIKRSKAKRALSKRTTAATAKAA